MYNGRLLERLKRIESEMKGDYDKDQIFIATTNKDGTFTHKEALFTKEELNEHLKEHSYEIVVIL